jgi:hypothetical protein
MQSDPVGLPDQTCWAATAWGHTGEGEDIADAMADLLGKIDSSRDERLEELPAVVVVTMRGETTRRIEVAQGPHGRELTWG